MSPSRKVPYSRVAAEAWNYYKTQNDFTDAQLKEFTEMPVRLIFGKSLVGGSATTMSSKHHVGAVAYTRARGYVPLRRDSNWNSVGLAFYHAFWPAHISSTLTLFAGGSSCPRRNLWVSAAHRNDTDAPKQVTLRSTLSSGWSQKPDATIYTYLPMTLRHSAENYPGRGHKDTWQTLNVARAEGKVSARSLSGLMLRQMDFRSSSVGSDEPIHPSRCAGGLSARFS